MLTETPTLSGRIVKLVPNTAAHDGELHRITPLDTFDLFLSAPADASAEAFAAYMRAYRENSKSRVFTVLSASGDRVLGSTSYMDIDAKNRCVEIGATWYAPQVRATGVNPECKLLLLEHAFGVLGCVRVTLKTDERNVRSQGAMAKFGAVREGVLRAHRITASGYVRNTVMFSVLPSDWARVRAHLEARVAQADARLPEF
ncbi:MAG: GNAT family N-acetyltransferase [Phycisphaerales bacterium]|nr:GNAT family N-acetyltransferase [Phycisphaerales bacterium]